MLPGNKNEGGGNAMHNERQATEGCDGCYCRPGFSRFWVQASGQGKSVDCLA